MGNLIYVEASTLQSTVRALDGSRAVCIASQPRRRTSGDEDVLFAGVVGGASFTQSHKLEWQVAIGNSVQRYRTLRCYVRLADVRRNIHVVTRTMVRDTRWRRRLGKSSYNLRCLVCPTLSVVR